MNSLRMRRVFSGWSPSSIVLFTLVALTLACPSPTVMAAGGRQIQGAFAVTATASPNASGDIFCGGAPLQLTAEGHGDGYTSLGALSLSLRKTIDVPGAMHGCLTLTTPNGDTLDAIYDGTESAPNANGFLSANGTLTFTGGTGVFDGASGSAKFRAVFLGLYPLSSFLGGTSAPLQVAAYYVIEGHVFSNGDE